MSSVQVAVAVVIVQMYVGKVRRAGAEPVRRRYLGYACVRVAKVEADPQPRVAHGADDPGQIRRLRLHDVFKAHGHAVRDLLYKVPPERLTARKEPLRVIDQRLIARVEDDFVDVQFLRARDGLPVALFCHIQHKGIDGRGRQLVERAVEDKPLC